jgi:hypothetical protein
MTHKPTKREAILLAALHAEITRTRLQLDKLKR